MPFSKLQCLKSRRLAQFRSYAYPLDQSREPGRGEYSEGSSLGQILTFCARGVKLIISSLPTKTIGAFHERWRMLSGQTKL